MFVCLHNTLPHHQINPSLILFKSRLLLATGLAWGVIEGKAANEHLEYRWANNSYFPFPSQPNSIDGKNKYLGVGNNGLDPIGRVGLCTHLHTFTSPDLHIYI
jgi:hypothetical protein